MKHDIFDFNPRMTRAQREKFEGLPFETPTPSASGERSTPNG